MNTILNRYAKLLVHYCLELKKGEKLLVRSTTLAEPLVREIYREALAVGGIPDTILSFREQNRLLLSMGKDEQLEYISPLYQKAIETYDAFLHIRAPFNLKEDQNVPSAAQKKRQQAMRSLLNTYFERTGSRDLKRSLCQYPTLASAQAADMSLEEYQDFVFRACKLMDDDPTASWLEVRHKQQRIVDKLSRHKVFRYKTGHTDITFSAEGRTWINSDGQTNMPSGEVYTSPVEDSVNGVIHFTYPAIYQGHEVEDVTLWVKDGLVEKWEAKKGKSFLDHIFSIKGARHFGEAAIGTNYDIDRLTKNILFDEKIGGTVHMAIGQSYRQAGGRNVSAVHWDMITDMTKDGSIYADDEIIYEKGQFIF